MSPLFSASLAAAPFATACALLSVVVVLRRWAFVGEGIGHAGFGGAGTAWLVALVIPSLNLDWGLQLFVAAFCVLAALGIGRLSRSTRVSADAAIGVFLVASLAWGFLARQIYFQHRHAWPAGFDTLLFGQMRDITPTFALGAAAASVAVLVVIGCLGKEILAYAFDPLTAQTAGVRLGLIHYLLMALLAAVVVVGTQIVGSVLVTALLVLPGVTAMALARRLTPVLLTSIIVALVAIGAGLLVNARFPVAPVGPCVVLALVVQFAGAFTFGRVRGGTHY